MQALLRLREHQKFNKIEQYEPYPFQVAFHHCPRGVITNPFKVNGPIAPVRTILAGNKIGKCISFNTLVDHPDGTSTKAGVLYERGEDFPVNSWDGEKVVPSMATGFIKKSSEMVYRFTMSDGRWFECAANHRILTDGGYVFARQLYGFRKQFDVSRPQSSSDICRSVRGEDGRHCSQKQLNYQDDYSKGCHPHGGQLLFGQGIDRACFPLSAGAQPQSLIGCGSSDAQAYSGASNHLQAAYLLSSCYAGCRSLGRFGASLYRAFSNGFQWCIRGNRNGQQLDGSEYHRQPYDEEQFHQSETLQAYPVPLSVTGNKIVSVIPVSVQEIYDFSVPEFGNYVTAGIVHHNTEAAGYELAYHLTGLYPDWWMGKRFAFPVKIIAAGPTNDKTRDVIQAILFGEPTDKDEFGTGTIPRHLIMDTVRKAGVPNALDSSLIRHSSGGKSKIGFSAFEQKLESFMGFKAHIILLDEEPPQPVLSQCVRATIAHPETMILMTFTPEHGSTDLVYRLKTELPKNYGLVRAGWRDAPHIWDIPGRVEELRSMFPKYEWEMRENGDPVIGTGRVFEVPESEITCPPFEIPVHWPRIAGIDFGMEHPFAGSWIAHDTDNDIVYVYESYKKEDMFIPEAASTLKKRGQWIPIVWPHDMAKRATGIVEGKSGETIAQLFEAEGCKMLEKCFTNPPDPNKKEGSGGNSVSAGILSMETRMVTGGFKVFSTNSTFFEEFRNYHTENGVIVKKRDDIMDATRYACQSLRFARVLRKIRPKQHVRQGTRLF